MRKLTVIIAAMAMSCGLAYAGKPLKVYILVGQSNMQGTANISTAKHMAADPKAKDNATACTVGLPPLRASRFRSASHAMLATHALRPHRASCLSTPTIVIRRWP